MVRMRSLNLVLRCIVCCHAGISIDEVDVSLRIRRQLCPKLFSLVLPAQSLQSFGINPLFSLGFWQAMMHGPSCPWRL